LRHDAGRVQPDRNYSRCRLWAAFEEEHAHAAKIESSEIVLECPPRQLRDLAGYFNTGRTTSDDDKREPRPANVQIVFQFGHLERAEDPCPLIECVRERFHSGRPLRVLVVPEVRLPDARSDDQAVVGERHLPSARLHGGDVPCLEIESGHLGEFDRDVLLLLENVTRRGCYLPFGEDSRGHLIEERLEQMVVGATDQCDLNHLRRAPQRLGGKEPAEARTNDHDAMACCARPGHGPFLDAVRARDKERGVRSVPGSCRPARARRTS
jgi:hypothetical protein